MKDKLEKLEMMVDDDLDYLVMLEKREDKLNDEYINLFLYNSIRDYSCFFKKYKYAMFGDIIFWLDESEFLEHQNDLIEYNVPKQDEYICIGEIEPYPLIINKSNGIVSYLINEVEYDYKMVNLGMFNDFIDSYVIGSKYMELGSIEEWNDFLISNKFI